MRLSVLPLFAVLVLLTACTIGTPVQRLPLTLPPNAVLLDVRTPDEYLAGHLAGAVNVPDDQVLNLRASLPQDLNTPIALYCRSGRRVQNAMQLLRQLGYSNLYSLGGIRQAQQSLQLNIVTGNTR